MTQTRDISLIRRRLLFFLPLALMGLLFGVLLYRLSAPNNVALESQWVGQSFPIFDLPAATEGVEGLNSRSFTDGQPRLVNIFASWCIPCRVEAPQLEALAEAGVIIEAIAIRDRPEDVAEFLKYYGNPFAHIGGDWQSEVPIALGSAGVPETFIVDGQGIIREQIQGAILPGHTADIIAKLEALK